ncbi:MAG TPA: OmpH family outer membrane protein [Pyrinomonadaceae bacterium]|nr:OmpH family outer membrane protein [Pyrinomonadaceae bacterium]
MKVIRNTAAAAILAAFAALSASAQTTPARPAPAGGGAAPAAANNGGVVPDGKVATIDTDAFADQKAGIGRLVAVYSAVEREFKPRGDELRAMKTRYDGIVKQVNDTKAVADQKALAALADQAETLEKEMKRRQEDLQASSQKRFAELAEPVYRDIGQALQNFAKQRGITVVFDLSKTGNAVMVVNNAIDITDAFIADYNQRNPASAASAAPARP